MEKQNLKKVLMAFISACSFMPICAQTGNFSFLQVNNGAQSDAAVLATGNENNKLIVRSELTQPGFCESFRLLHQFESNRNNGYIGFHRGESTNGGFLTFGSNGVERMRIDRYGYVGIGIQQPKTILDIYSDEVLGSNAGNYLPLTRLSSNVGNRCFISDFMLRETAGSSWVDASYMKGISVDVSFIEPNTLRSWIKQNPGTEKIEFGSSGMTFMSVGANVGIGTVSPSDKLVVSKGTSELRLGGDNGRSISAYNSGSLSNIDFHALFTYFDSNAIFGAKKKFYFYNNAGTKQDYANIQVNSTENLSFGINNIEALTITNNGIVRVGTDNTSGELQVNGTISAKEVTVKDPVWADFVFDKDYKLRDLKEVDQYIQDNGHLPEIPSVAEVKEKGVNIVEVQAKLLQKVEEMTLYIIELQKEIERLKSKIN